MKSYFCGVRPILILTTLYLSVFVHAEEKHQAVELRFVSFPKVVDPKPMQLSTGDGKFLDIELPSGSFSKTYSVAALPKWKLGKTKKEADGKEQFKAYGEVQALDAASQLIVALRKGENHDEGLRLIPINCLDDGFVAGTCYLINTADVAIKGDIGGTPFSIEPDGTDLIKQGVSERKGERALSFVKFTFGSDAGFQIFYNSTWRCTPTVRSLVIFYIDPATKRPKFHIVRDYVTTPAQ